MLLQADSLRFSYAGAARGGPFARVARSRARAPVIDDVSIDVPQGAFVGILGPNGSGKTTLLKLLSGALRPDEGSIRLEGRGLSSISRRELAQRVAMVPQNTHLAFDYTVLEIVLMGRYPWLQAFEVEGPDDLAAALDALEATGTRHLADRAYRTLSGGEQQRVIVASVLAQLDTRSHGPTRAARRTGSTDEALPLLFLDEPTASLDLKYQIEITSLLRHLHLGRHLTVLLSTHDLRLAARLCTWTILLADGRILAEGPPGDMLRPALIGQLYGIGPEVAAPLLG